MTRDMELVREILLELEKSNDFIPKSQAIYEAMSVKNDVDGMRNILWHLQLMEQASLVQIHWEELDNWQSDGPTFAGAQITWNGYDFLAAALNDTVWNGAKKLAGEHFKSMSLSALTSLMQFFIRTQIPGF